MVGSATTARALRARRPRRQRVDRADALVRIHRHLPHGEDADGFAAKLTVGAGNVFRRAVSHHDTDDGRDLCTKPGTGPL
ncbi:hypothetical protein GCM10010275_69980 [Streptomyces litmocidini]|nr:hypothetical protein GCM10010275_69980 [Streptomyces litmocidini]